MIKHERNKIAVSVAILCLMPAPVFANDNDGQYTGEDFITTYAWFATRTCMADKTII